jgi:hypothetical protein
VPFQSVDKYKGKNHAAGHSPQRLYSVVSLALVHLGPRQQLQTLFGETKLPQPEAEETTGVSLSRHVQLLVSQIRKLSLGSFFLLPAAFLLDLDSDFLLPAQTQQEHFAAQKVDGLIFRFFRLFHWSHLGRLAFLEGDLGFVRIVVLKYQFNLFSDVCELDLIQFGRLPSGVRVLGPEAVSLRQRGVQGLADAFLNSLCNESRFGVHAHKHLRLRHYIGVLKRLRSGLHL